MLVILLSLFPHEISPAQQFNFIEE